LVECDRAVSTAVDVLVVGAGPTGLTTALQAHDHGAEVRIVEQRPRAFRPSRAMIVHPRTLESLRPLGVTDALLDRGDRAPKAELDLRRRRCRSSSRMPSCGRTATWACAAANPIPICSRTGSSWWLRAAESSPLRDGAAGPQLSVLARSRRRGI
jgi:glycine/D-amino acid oxidase-like deaminating enzyme